MSAIKQALTSLDAAIGKLENSITAYQHATEDRIDTIKVEAQKKARTELESEAKLKQSDMFSDVDPALVTKKLDSAIAKVEKVLEEA